MRRILRTEHLVPAMVVAVLVLTRTVAAPAEPGWWVALGALLAPGVMAYAHRWAAAWAAFACGASWPVLDRWAGVRLGWAVLLPWALVAVAMHTARYEREQVEHVSPRRPAPRPPELPRIGGPALALAAALLVLAAGLIAAVVGGRTPGLWLVAAITAAGLGAALIARVGRRRRELVALFTDPQPVRSVRVVDDFGYVHVLMPAADGRTAVEFGIDVDEPVLLYAGEHTGDPETRPAVLYGEPRPGRWCTVDVGGRLRVPVAPIAATTEIPYDAEHALPREVADDDGQLVDPDHLLPADRDAAPDEVREHRVAPLRRWFEAVAIGAGASLVAAEIVRLTGFGHPVRVVAVVAAVAYEFGWRTQLRPRLRWDVGGIAAIGFRRRERAVWDADSAVVHDDDGTVIVLAGDVVLAVDAPRPWGAAQRTAEQLVAALRDARRQALDRAGAPAPPDIKVPGRPLLLYAAWAVTVAAALTVAGR